MVKQRYRKKSHSPEGVNPGGGPHAHLLSQDLVLPLAELTTLSGSRGGLRSKCKGSVLGGNRKGSRSCHNRAGSRRWKKKGSGGKKSVLSPQPLGTKVWRGLAMGHLLRAVGNGKEAVHGISGHENKRRSQESWGRGGSSKAPYLPQVLKFRGVQRPPWRQI